MASEIRVDKINSLSGVGTVTLSPTGVDIAGITTAATLRATTGIVTSLTAGSLTSLSDVKVGSGVTLSPDGDIFAIGISTFTNVIDVHKDSTTTYDATDDGGQRTDTASITLRNDNGSTDTFSQLVFDTAGSNQSIARIVALRTASASNALTFVTEHSNTKAERLRIASDGKVGINSTAPSNLFTIESTDNNQFAIKSNDTNADIILADTGGSARIRHTGTNFEIWTGGAAGSYYAQSSARRVTIDSNGNLGVNQTSPGAKLDTSSGSDSAMGLRVSGGASGGTNIAQFRTNNGTSRLTVNNDVVVETGNLKIGTSGKGIDFSITSQAASPSSEVLDDYEEGTWTFAINPGSGSYQYNYGTNGYYRKIGNTVFINAWIHLTVSSAVSGGITLTGLPFTCQPRSRNWIPVGGYGHSSAINGAGLWMICTPNATTASFYYTRNDYGPGASLTAGNLPTSAEMYINGSYFTDQ